MKKLFSLLFIVVTTAMFANSSESLDPPDDGDPQGCYYPNGPNYCRPSFDGERCYIEGPSEKCCWYSM